MSGESRSYGTEYFDQSATKTGLSNEDLAVRIKEGQKELIPELWNNVRLLIISKARAYHASTVLHRGSASFEVDDLITSGFEALLQAVEYFEPGEGSKLSTVLCKYYLRRAFQTVAGIKQIEKAGEDPETKEPLWKVTKDPGLDAESLDAPVTDSKTGEDTGDTFADRIAGPDNVEETITAEVFDSELHEQLEKALKTLRPEYEMILRRYYYDMEPGEQIAEDLGVSRKTVHDRRKAALEDLYSRRYELSLDQYIELHTPYYTKFGLNGFKQTGLSTVEYIVLKRQKLAASWLRKYRGGT